MRKILLVLAFSLSACQPGPPGFKSVDFPAEVKRDWIKSRPVGSVLASELWGSEEEEAFAGEVKPVAAIRVSASPADFYGSKLFDGFDFTLQPLDAENRPVKRMGRLSVILYSFDIDSVAGKGQELMRWHVMARDIRGLWRRDAIDEAYHMKLAWTKRPDIDYVKMEVRFTTIDFRTYTKLITPASIDQPRYGWLKK